MPEAEAGWLCQFPGKGPGLREPRAGAGLSPDDQSSLPAWVRGRLDPHPALLSVPSGCQREGKKSKVLGDFGQRS